MQDLLLHPRTKTELRALLRDPPHALLFVAPTGSGKLTLATAWARELAAKAAVSVLEPDEKGTITIEATRTLYQRTRAKQAGHQVVIIDHAEAMSGEAQNAFLKLLEEPRAGLTFILTTPHTEDLLPTILSRVQVVQVHPVPAVQLMEAAKQHSPQLDQQALTQLLFVADGRPGVLMAALADDAVFAAHKQTMQRAKQLLGGTHYDRLALVQELSKDKLQLVATLEAMARMLGMQIRSSGQPQWVALADNVQETLRRLRQNGNPRAQLVHLFMTY